MAATQRAAVRLLLTSVLLVAGADAAGAAPGDLDVTFGGDGIVTTNFGGQDRAYAAALQADGKLVVGGTTASGANSDFALVRYDTNGSLDPGFGGDGVVVTDLGGSAEEIHGVVAQPDGSLVVAGVSDPGGDADIVLVRYAADGSLDSSFGTGGVVFTDLASGDDGALALVRQANGKLVVAGFAFTGIFTELAVARYDPGGSPDLGFASGGVSTTALGFDTAIARALVLQSDGKLVAAGAADFVTTGDEIVLVRLGSGGALDSSFDGDGVVTLSFTSGDDVAHAAALQADGRIVIAGESPGGASHHLTVLRRLGSGAADPSFDLDGAALYPLGSASGARGVLAQGDGRIVVAGQRVSGGYADVVLLRLEPDGGLDATFGSGGVVVTSIAAGDDSGAALLPAGGKLVVAGTSFNGSDDDFAALRYLGSDCGDDTVDAGEQCDDGNLAAGDCCSPTCQFESSASPCAADSLICTADHCNGSGTCVHTAGNAGTICRPAAHVCDAADSCAGASTTCPADAAAPNGTSCADALFCNGAETCVAGTCQAGTAPCAAECDESLDTCVFTCPAAPRADCRTAERNGLVIRNAGGGAASRLTWRWLRGQTTAQTELADPRVSASYLLCLYESSGGALALQAFIPPNATRWTALGGQQDRGFRYNDVTASVAGLRRLLLRPSTGDSAKASFLGKGAALPDAMLPLDLPVRVQLNNSATGVCLGSTFSSAKRNDGAVFRP